MSGSTQAADALQSAVRAELVNVAEAVRGAQRAQSALSQAEDLVDVMRATAGVVLAMEAMQAAAKVAETAGRTRLAATMADTGATAIQTERHTVSLRDAAQVVRITDATLLPPEMLRQPPPEPDKAAIKKALAYGTVMGAELSNGGPATVSFRSKK